MILVHPIKNNFYQDLSTSNKKKFTKIQAHPIINKIYQDLSTSNKKQDLPRFRHIQL